MVEHLLPSQHLRKLNVVVQAGHPRIQEVEEEGQEFKVTLEARPDQRPCFKKRNKRKIRPGVAVHVHNSRAWEEEVEKSRVQGHP